MNLSSSAINCNQLRSRGRLSPLIRPESAYRIREVLNLLRLTRETEAQAQSSASDFVRKRAVQYPMEESLTESTLFKRIALSPLGPVRWGTPIPDDSPGVYVITLSADANASTCDMDADYLETSERLRWIPNQPIIYIGQATRQTLATRLRQFYRHIYGARASR
jgi:hypothetical protein